MNEELVLQERVMRANGTFMKDIGFIRKHRQKTDACGIPNG
jgi:hypothetical protein